MALTSMTGFATVAGGADTAGWVWEARSVNGRSLDLRLRLAEGFETLDPIVRAAASGVLARGTVTVSLRFARGASSGVLPRLNPAALDAAVTAALAAGEAAAAAGLDLAPMTAADLLSVRGVLEGDSLPPSEDPALVAAIQEGAAALFAALSAARAAEGAAIAGIVAGQLDRIAALVVGARTTAEARSARSGELLGARMAALLAGTAAVDEARLAQELALLAVRADVTEELDRLEAHVGAARVLIAGAGPAGRKLDFLMQEFNREANTLCSKAGSAELTAVGLELKAVIDQMREQVQNVE